MGFKFFYINWIGIGFGVGFKFKIRIDNSIAKGRLGMSYRVTLKGKDLATLTMASPNGKKSFITGDHWYDVETSEEDLSLTFLTIFAIARTEQTFYD